MKYIVKNGLYIEQSTTKLLNLLLTQRGVANIERFLNLDESVLHNPSLFMNMEFGLNMFHHHISNNSRIHLVIDSDLDGFSSSALIYNYIKQIDNNITITFSTHNNRKRGITDEVLSNYEYDLLIVTDSGSSDIKMCEKLANQGKDILILDHHHFTPNSNLHACVINCHDNVYPNGTLSGVQVTYKFCKAYDERFGYNYADDYLDLVSLGTIGDNSDIRNHETRYLVLKGLEQIGNGNGLINALYKCQYKQMGYQSSISSVGWYLIPLINSVARHGTLAQKYNLFNCLINKTNNYEQVIGVCNSIKKKYDYDIKRAVKRCMAQVEENKLDHNKIIILDVTRTFHQTLTGIVASKLTNKYQRPVVLLRQKLDDKNVFGGSGRGYSKFELDSLRDFLLESGQFNSIEGHDNAFAVTIHKNNIDNLIKYINDRLSHVEIDYVYHVDFEFKLQQLQASTILQLASFKNLWGGASGRMSEPTFVINNVQANDIKYNEKDHSITFYKVINGNSVEFVKKYTNEDTFNRMKLKDNMTIICKFSSYVLCNEINPVIEIIDFD